MTKKTRLSIIVVWLASTINAQSLFKVDDIYYKYIDASTKNELMVCAPPSDSATYTGEITIPDEVVFIDSITSNDRKPKVLPVVQIASKAFANSNITRILLGKNIQVIGSDAFKGCDKLSGKTIFSSWNQLLNISFYNEYSNPLFLTKHLFIGDENAKEIKYLQIPDSINASMIGDLAFAGCEHLDSVSIPASIKYVGAKAFLGCSGLKRARFASQADLCNLVFASKEANPLYYANHLFVGTKSQEETEITIPESYEYISNGAFAGCTEITKVTLSDKITHIGADAFINCNSLYTVNFLTSKSISEANSILASGIHYGNDNSNPMRFAKMFLINGSEQSAISISHDIESNAFFGAKWLERITIAKSVKKIGGSAFRNCPNLWMVEFENGSELTTIESDAFNGCEKLDNLTLPSSLDTIGVAAFRNCSKLSSITIPENVKKLYEEIFVNCTNLSSVIINTNNITNIPKRTFMGCSSLSSVKLSKNIQTIYEEAFSGCGLTKLPKGGSITYILENAFANCKFEEIELDTTITIIGKQAFKSQVLKNLYIPEQSRLSNIGENAFLSNNLSNVYSYRKVAPNANIKAFGDNPQKINLFYNANSTGYDVSPWSDFSKRVFSNKTIVYYIDNDSVHCDTIQVGDVVKEWDVVAEWGKEHRAGWKFSGWSEQIPTVMPDYNLEIHGFFTTEKNIDGLTYLIEPTKTTTKVVADVEAYKKTAVFSIPDSITFGNNKYLVAAIDDYAFKNSTSLEKINFSDSLLHIGKGAFVGCKQLQSITLPAKITTIADSLFYECSSLTNVSIPNSINSIGASAFNRCSSLNLDTLPSQLENLGELAFCRSGITFMKIPKGVKAMGTRVFLNCEQLDSIKFEDGFQITTLPDYTFQNCIRLKSFKLAPATTSIGSGAFSGCSSISQLIINNGISSIGGYAFNGCTKLKEITFPSSIGNIQNNAFSGCESISQITIEKATPPSAAGSAFTDNTYNTVQLYVPLGSESAYSTKIPWNRFGNRIQSIADNPLIYLVDGKVYGDTLLVRVGKTITPLQKPQKEGRSFKGWENLPSVMPNDTVIAIGAFKYQFKYTNADTQETVYADSVFYGTPLSSIKDLSARLEIEGYKYEVVDTILTMPANDTIINVKYYPTETDFAFNGLTYHIYTEDNPHAELIPVNPIYSGTSYNVPDSIVYRGNKYSVTRIRSNAFKDCGNLKSITLSESITEIGTQAFRSCSSLSEITIPKSVEILGNEIFLNSKIKNVIDFDKCIKIDKLPANIFMDCDALEFIDLPSSITTIGSDAFRGCKELKELTIPENVTSVGERALQGCEKLRKIYIANQSTLPIALKDIMAEEDYEKDTLYVSETVQKNMTSPWDKFNVELGGSTTAEKCATPRIYYDNGTLRFECETENAEIKSEVTVTDAVKSENISLQTLNKKYIIKAYATAIGHKRSDTAVATIVWRNGTPIVTGFAGTPDLGTEDQKGVPGDMNGDNQVTAEDASLILKSLVDKQ